MCCQLVRANFQLPFFTLRQSKHDRTKVHRMFPEPSLRPICITGTQISCLHTPERTESKKKDSLTPFATHKQQLRQKQAAKVGGTSVHRHTWWDGFSFYFFILLYFCVEHSGGRKSKEISAGLGYWNKAACQDHHGKLNRLIREGALLLMWGVWCHKLFLECVSVNIPAEFPRGLR